MADETTSIALDTKGYEEPLKSLTSAMIAFNATTITADVQQRQLAKTLGDTAQIVERSARVFIGAQKSMQMMANGPSDTLSKQYQSAINTLNAFAPTVKKIQTEVENLTKKPVIPDLKPYLLSTKQTMTDLVRTVTQTTLEARKKVEEAFTKPLKPVTVRAVQDASDKDQDAEAKRQAMRAALITGLGSKYSNLPPEKQASLETKLSRASAQMVKDNVPLEKVTETLSKVRSEQFKYSEEVEASTRTVFNLTKALDQKVKSYNAVKEAAEKTALQEIANANIEERSAKLQRENREYLNRLMYIDAINMLPEQLGGDVQQMKVVKAKEAFLAVVNKSNEALPDLISRLQGMTNEEQLAAATTDKNVAAGLKFVDVLEAVAAQTAETTKKINDAASNKMELWGEEANEANNKKIKAQEKLNATMEITQRIRAMLASNFAKLPEDKQMEIAKNADKLAKEFAEAENPIQAFEAALEKVNKQEKTFGDLTNPLVRDLLKIKTTVESVTGAIHDQAKADEVYNKTFASVRDAMVPKYSTLTTRQQLSVLPQIENAAKQAKQLFIQGMKTEDIEAEVKRWSTAIVRGESAGIDASNKLASALMGVQVANEQVGNAVDISTKKWQRFGQLIEARAITMLFYNLMASMRESLQVSIDLSKNIGEIQTISQNVAVSTERWNAGAEKLSNTYGMLQTDVAEGLYQTISNQVASGEQALGFMDKAAKFAWATKSTMADSINLLSGALNSFQMDVSEVDNVASQFFETIYRGRVRAQDMAETFGRSAMLAHQAGVSLSEWNSMIQVFTINGVRFDQASTYMINVINKLMKPSEKMKELFHEWGVTSGSAAIQVYGFSGILRKLLTETSGDLGEISELIKDIRGSTGLSGLLANLNEYDTGVKLTTDSTAAYFKAVQSMTETTGFIIQREQQRYKNYFMSWSKTTLDTVAALEKLLEKGGTSVSGITTSSLVPFVTVGIGLASIRGLAEALGGGAPANLIKKFGMSLTMIAATYSAISGIYDWFTKVGKSGDELVAEVDLQLTQVRKLEADMQRAITQSVQDKNKELIKAQEAEKTVYEDQLAQQKAFYKDSMEQGKQHLTERKQQLEQEISDLKQGIKDGDKWMADFRRKMKGDSYNESLEFADPLTKFTLQQQHAQEAKQDAYRLLGKATDKEGMREAREQMEQAYELSKEIEKIQYKELGLPSAATGQYARSESEKFMQAYAEKQAELEQTSIPNLQEQIEQIAREIKTYGEFLTYNESIMQKSIVTMDDFLERIRKRNLMDGEWSKILEQNKGLLEGIFGKQRDIDTLDQTQVKQRQDQTAEIEAQRKDVSQSIEDLRNRLTGGETKTNPLYVQSVDATGNPVPTINGSQIPGFAGGGRVFSDPTLLREYLQRHPEDTIPALLSPGEFVVNADATQQNLPLLEAINQGRGPRPGTSDYNLHQAFLARGLANAQPFETLGDDEYDAMSKWFKHSRGMSMPQMYSEFVNTRDSIELAIAEVRKEQLRLGIGPSDQVKGNKDAIRAITAKRRKLEEQWDDTNNLMWQLHLSPKFQEDVTRQTLFTTLRGMPIAKNQSDQNVAVNNIDEMHEKLIRRMGFVEQMKIYSDSTARYKHQIDTLNVTEKVLQGAEVAGSIAAAIAAGIPLATGSFAAYGVSIIPVAVSSMLKKLGISTAIGAGIFGGQKLYEWLFGGQKKAMGGLINAPGFTPGTDSVPALLTPGEFVVNARSTQEHLPLLQNINARRFGYGGYVNSVTPRLTLGSFETDSSAQSEARAVHYNNNVTINASNSPAYDAHKVISEINRQQYRGAAKIRT